MSKKPEDLSMYDFPIEIESINKLVVCARQSGEENADNTDYITKDIMDAMYELVEALGYKKEDFNIVFEDGCTPQLEEV